MNQEKAKTKFYASTVSFYDAGAELYYTYLGTHEGDRNLYASAWGTTEKQSQERANNIVDLLNQNLCQIT